MEKGSVIGLGAGIVLIYGAIFTGAGWQTFFDPVSLVLVLGGTVAALLVAFSIDELKQIPGGLKGMFTYSPPDLGGYLKEFYELSRTARREGLLALDRRLGEIDDPFLAFGLEMAVDGIDEGEVDELMRDKISTEAQQRGLASKFFNTAGTYAPAFGMIGTLVGLIQMLQNLSDPAAIGPAMAVAMITTFYGAFFANLVFLPFANKVKTQTGEIIKGRDMVRVGVLSIVRGESPSMVEKRLRLYLDGQEVDLDGEAAPAKAA